jgi:menaquinone-specific isochorismate synthase
MRALAVDGGPAARTYPIADAGPILDLPQSGHPLAWVRDGQGLVGWGEYARLEVSGVDRFAVVQRWWDELLAGLVVEDSVGVPGTGPVAFASFGFSALTDRSVVIVPRVVAGRRDGRSWTTVIGDEASSEKSPTAVIRPTSGSVHLADGALDAAKWLSIVRDAITRIGGGELRKVVLARDLIATAAGPIDQGRLLRRLADRYPACWAFAVDGLVGATPELLVSRFGDQVRSRVLAGTVTQGGPSSSDADRAAALRNSAKDIAEHGFAVQSVADALAKHSGDLQVPSEPHVLALANVQHLVTDISGRVNDGSSVLALAGALHPTAAVCGTPTDVAFEVIRELEGMDRDRYAGPVGWIGAHGDGEFGVALRCALVSGSQARLFAGCGIVGDSDPQSELAEADAKFSAVRDALTSDC